METEQSPEPDRPRYGPQKRWGWPAATALMAIGAGVTLLAAFLADGPGKPATALLKRLLALLGLIIFSLGAYFRP